MDCFKIDNAVLDEVVMGRCPDAEVLAHLETCAVCAKRLEEHRAYVDSLKYELERWNRRE